MSLKVEMNKLSNIQRKSVNEELFLVLKNDSKTLPDKEIQPFDIVNNDIYLPFNYACNNLNFKRPDRKSYPSMNVNFEGELREEQIIVKKEALEKLSTKGCTILSLYTGFGKTILAINLSCNIKLKTLIIVNKLVLIKQWEESILKFCPTALIQKLTAKSKIQDADFYIMNAMNVEKMGRKFYQSIGNVICDEAHLLVAEILSKSLQYLTPRYLIALSATPYRLDGLNKLLDLYFGEDKIIRDMNREHIIYKVNTGIEIEMELVESTGKVNWGAVLKAQSENEERNDLIIKIIQEFKDRNFLVLCKRVEQSTYLFKKLKDLGEYTDNLIGTKQDFDRNCRILVGIHQKVGTGFDWAKADALLLATDLDSYFIQALGRIFRKKDTLPIVFDLVDKNFILTKHFKNRVEVYEKVGGKIVSFNKKYPTFFKT
jgi:superfamily II DNA or RNA helicase